MLREGENGCAYAFVTNNYNHQFMILMYKGDKLELIIGTDNVTFEFFFSIMVSSGR